jgi:PAS domain S-box-containing protein
MVDDTRTLSKPIAAGISAVGLLIALMVALELIAKTITLNYYPFVIYFTFVSTIVITPLLLLSATYYSALKMVALAWVHVSMAIMSIYFSQTYSPFTPAWSILILISSTYFGWSGFAWSSSVLILTAGAYLFLFPDSVNPYGGILNYSILSILIVSLTIFIAFLFVRVIMTSKRQNRELAKAQESEILQINRLNTLLNSISDAVMTLNRYGRVTSQNAAAQAFFDTNQSLIGRDIDTLLQLKDHEEKQITVRSLIDNVKTSALRDDLSDDLSGYVRHLSIQISRIRSTFNDSEEYGVVLIIRDITRQKTLEEEKDEFISVTSHELRTPIAIAEGSLSNFVQMQKRHMDESKLRESAEAAHEQVIYLAKMINDLSTLSRAERGIGDGIEPIKLNDLLHDLYNRYTPEAETKGLHLNLDADASLPEMETSRLYLEEILQNFITNSIKYTKEGSVTFGAKQLPGDKVRFFVTDTGIGMSKTDLDHIFEKFYRSEDYRTRETTGTGLGLYVVNKLATKLDTKIEVDSRLDHGSTFSFVLPVKSSRTTVKTEPVTQLVS